MSLNPLNCIVYYYDPPPPKYQLRAYIFDLVNNMAISW